MKRERWGVRERENDMQRERKKENKRKCLLWDKQSVRR